MREVYYKGFIIYERDNGWWESYINGKWQRFDNKFGAFSFINNLKKQSNGVTI
jgi:hypothetical protein